MDYSTLTPEVKSYFINDYTKKATELREKAENPRARKPLEYLTQAARLIQIVQEIKNS